MKLFHEAKESREYEIPFHYAILPHPETPQSEHERSSFLLGLNIQPIWYPTGDHTFVERYLRLAIDTAAGVISL